MAWWAYMCLSWWLEWVQGSRSMQAGSGGDKPMRELRASFRSTAHGARRLGILEELKGVKTDCDVLVLCF